MIRYTILMHLKKKTDFFPENSNYSQSTEAGGWSELNTFEMKTFEMNPVCFLDNCFLGKYILEESSLLSR
jgi:hypothetical protein